MFRDLLMLLADDLDWLINYCSDLTPWRGETKLYWVPFPLVVEFEVRLP